MTLFSGQAWSVVVATALAGAILPVALPESMLLAQTRGQRPRIAVLNFDFSSVSSPYANLNGASRGVSDLLINRLVKDGAYTLIERSKLDQILAEQNLGSSGRIDAATAAQVGRILGVDAVVIGSVTRFDVQTRNSGGGAPLVIPFGSLPIGLGATSRDVDAVVQLTVRVVNTSTAEILTVAEGSGNSSQSDSSVTIAGFGGGANTSNEEKLLALASDQAVGQVAQQLSAAASQLVALPKPLPTVSALVADVSPGSVVLNKGTGAGFQKGMKVTIERVTREVKDPTTGKVLRTLSQPIGQAELVDVDGVSAVAKVISGSGFRVGDIAKPTQ